MNEVNIAVIDADDLIYYISVPNIPHVGDRICIDGKFSIPTIYEVVYNPSNALLARRNIPLDNKIHAMAFLFSFK